MSKAHLIIKDVKKEEMDVWEPVASRDDPLMPADARAPRHPSPYYRNTIRTMAVPNNWLQITPETQVRTLADILRAHNERFALLEQPDQLQIFMDDLQDDAS